MTEFGTLLQQNAAKGWLFTMVLSFSVGLVLSGVVAAIDARHADKRWSGFEALAAR